MSHHHHSQAMSNLITAATPQGGEGLTYAGQAGHKNRYNRALDNRRKARANYTARKGMLAAVLRNEIAY